MEEQHGPGPCPHGIHILMGRQTGSEQISKYGDAEEGERGASVGLGRRGAASLGSTLHPVAFCFSVLPVRKISLNSLKEERPSIP